MTVLWPYLCTVLLVVDRFACVRVVYARRISTDNVAVRAGVDSSLRMPLDQNVERDKENGKVTVKL